MRSSLRADGAKRHRANLADFGWFYRPYRLAILAWSLWLAQAVIRWARWLWACFSERGLWRPLSAQKPAPPPATAA